MAATTERVEFKCPSGYGNGNFADPATCRRFYQVSCFFSVDTCVCVKDTLNARLCPFLFEWFFSFRFAGFPPILRMEGETHRRTQNSFWFMVRIRIAFFFVRGIACVIWSVN